MAIVAKLNIPRTLNVKVNSETGSLNPTTSGITLGNFTAGVNRLDQLVDVVESTPLNGDTLVYNAAQDKYYVQTLSGLTSNNISDLDGGSF